MTLAHLISVSGGKDSTSTYLRALERGLPFQAVFADTGNEHEATYDAVRRLSEITGGPEITWVKADFTDKLARKREYVARRWPLEGVPAAKVEKAISLLHPTGIPFLDLCLWKTRFPSAKTRFCTDELKIAPMFHHVQRPLLEAGRTLVSWQGVRAAESKARRDLPRLQRINPVPFSMPKALHDLGVNWTAFAYRPLIDWSVEDVFAYADRFGLPRNILYQLGFSRVGCFPCVMCRKEEMRLIGTRFPDHIERLEAWEAVVSDVSKTGNSTFFNVTDDPLLADGWQDADYDWSLSRTGIRARVEWSKTSRGGLQYDAFLSATENFGTACNEWGACE